jgi:hypothetical protein
MEREPEREPELSRAPEPIANQLPGHDSRIGMSESFKIDYIRPRQQQLKEYEIRIKFLSIGMIISVGCKEIPFTTVEEGMDALVAYTKNPHEEVKKWSAILDQ